MPPPPTPLPDGGTAVTPDVTAVDATLRFDVAARTATAAASVAFHLDDPGGHPALDLRQHPDRLRLDGRPLGPATFPHVDLGGGPGAEVRVLDTPLDPGDHLLEVDYRLGTPDAEGAQPIGWSDGGVHFDLWMSDLRPGRYLESWVPAPLCHDRFALTVTVEVTGTDRPHVVVANGGPEPLGPGCWRVRYPAQFTSLSPMLVVAPADDLRSVVGPSAVGPLTLWRHAEVDADLDACLADVTAWVAHNVARYGRWAHAPGMTAVLWGPGRGMEYDGATTASVEALEHEVFHSWFGRGVKPASAADGWIDEAFTSWATSTRRREGPRFAVEELGADLDPVVLRPASPWARHTPVESYAAGARLFAGVAWRLGGADRLRSAMASWYAGNAGGLVGTDDLRSALERWSGVGLGDLWDRYVDGRG